MGQICDIETVEPQESPIKVCVKFYNIEICYRRWGEEKASFLIIIYYTQMYGCRLIYGGGAICFSILMWDWY